MARRTKTNRERARLAAERSGMHPREMAVDIATLLEQIHTIEHEQDYVLIKAIADRYGFKL